MRDDGIVRGLGGSGVEHPAAAARHQLGAHRPGVHRHIPRRRRRERGVRREARRGKLRVQRLQQLVHHRRLAHDDRERRRQHADRVRGRGREGGAEVPRHADARASVARSPAAPSRCRRAPGAGSSCTGRRSARRRSRGSWDVTSLYTGDAISSPVPGSALTLEFAAQHGLGQRRLQHLHGSGEAQRHRRHHPRPARARRCARAPIRWWARRSSSTSPRSNWRRPTR